MGVALDRRVFAVAADIEDIEQHAPAKIIAEKELSEFAVLVQLRAAMGLGALKIGDQPVGFLQVVAHAEIFTRGFSPGAPLMR